MQRWVRVLLVLLSLSVAGCEPGPEVRSISFAHQQNHPNAMVATLLQKTPVVYPFTFVVMADIHLTYGEAVFAQLRQQILELNPTPVFVIIVGDLTGKGTMQEHQHYLAIIDPFPIPVFSVIGNHEMYPGARRNYSLLYGPEDFSFDYAGCRFSALNDIVPGRNGLNDTQMRWLERQFADPSAPDQFVFMHAPPPIEPPPWGAPPFFNSDRLYSLLERYGARMVASGHIHEYRHRLWHGIHFVTTGGGGGAQDPSLQDPKNQGIFHHFVVVTIEASGNSKLEVIKLGDSALPASDYTVRLDTRVVH